MAKFLVTGAAGFIGSAVTKRLLDEGTEVVTIDNLSTGKRSVIPDGCIFIKGNDFDEKIISQLNDYKFDAIIHIAGQSSGEVSFENPVYDLQTNAQSTLMLLNYAKNSGIKNFVFASSMSTYGDHNENPLVNESTPTVPKSFYAVGKLASENYMRIYSQMYGIRCTALRFFNVFGVGQNLDNLKQGMASIYLAMAIRKKHIEVKGASDRFRDFVYIDDVVESVYLAMNRTKGNLFEIFNVSNKRAVYVHEIISYIESHLPYTVSHEYIEGTPGDQKGIYGDFSKINSILGWTGTIPFEEGMQKMIDWAIKSEK